MSKYTPGPWLWETVEGDQSMITESSLKGPDVLCRYWYDDPPSADALLIAAAPEMAEMLLSMHVHGSHGGPTRAEVEALLRKAGVL
jgi:hypothetical protein